MQGVYTQFDAKDQDPLRSTPTPGEIALDFLRRFDSSGTHHLVAMSPHRPEYETFTADRLSDVRHWVDARAGRVNLYFTVNEVRADLGREAAEKKDVVSIRAVFGDIDPPPVGNSTELERARGEIRRRVDAVAHGYTWLIDSGGGFQVFFALDHKVPATADTIQQAEAVGRGLASSIGGDAVQNINRFMRLPGPDNIPTPEKVAKGRSVRPAAVVSATERKVGLLDLAKLFPATLGNLGADKDPEIDTAIEVLRLTGYDRDADLDDLDPDLRARFQADLARDSSLRSLWDIGVQKASDKTGSGHRFALAGALHRLTGYSIEEFAHLAGAWPLATLAGHDREAKLCERELARAWVRATPSGPEDFFKPVGEDASSLPVAPSQARRLLPTVAFADAARDALAAGARPLVKGLLSSGALSVVYGPSNVGKTFVALDLGFCVATGLPWAGLKTHKSGVLYVAAEGGYAVRKRIRALSDNFPRVDASGFRLVTASIDLRNPKGDLEPLIDTANADGEVGLIIIDTLSRAMAGGDENSSVDMGNLVRHLDEVRMKTGAHVMAIHHTGKDVARGARGHSLLKAAVDTEIEISEGRIDARKQRDFEVNLSRSFRLQKVILGVDEDGDVVTSAIVRIASTNDVPEGKATPTEAKVMLAVSGLIAQRADDAGVEAQEVADRLSSEGEPMKKETARKHLSNLTDKRLLAQTERGRWTISAVRGPHSEYSTSDFGLLREWPADAVPANFGTPFGIDIFA